MIVRHSDALENAAILANLSSLSGFHTFILIIFRMFDLNKNDNIFFNERFLSSQSLYVFEIATLMIVGNI